MHFLLQKSSIVLIITMLKKKHIIDGHMTYIISNNINTICNIPIIEVPNKYVIHLCIGYLSINETTDISIIAPVHRNGITYVIDQSLKPVR